MMITIIGIMIRW